MPVQGVAPFDAADAEFFFGRERLIADLVARLAGSSFVGIVGPSGSGKSSALRAGLLPALAAGALPGSAGRRTILIRPGEHLRLELGAPGSEPLVVAVDHLEELFTACTDEEERAAFLASLVEAVSDPDRRVLVVVALRADFYGRCAAYPRFAELLSRNHVLVGPMERDELARAIELPAVRAGLQVERALVDALVSDVAGEPGGLPLLSTALLELWRCRDGSILRHELYRASGGVRSAVARLAEEAYARLDEQDRQAVRTVMLRLADDEVRRRVPLDAFDADGRRVVGLLADARLLAVDDGSVEVAHEALLREWPRLRGWLEEDRENRSSAATWPSRRPLGMPAGATRAISTAAPGSRPLSSGRRCGRTS